MRIFRRHFLGECDEGEGEGGVGLGGREEGYGGSVGAVDGEAVVVEKRVRELERETGCGMVVAALPVTGSLVRGKYSQKYM